ncbi:MAG: aminotransferase class III-fold pyridoxal phosphate-dependent enzyme, partial [Clostridiales bacterium]
CKCECAQALETELQCRGANNYAAFMIEPIGGTSTGAMTPPAKYFKKIREICDKYELLLIYDEVMCGYGRTGKWLAAEHFGVKPDIVCLAKAISGGYYPVGSVCTTEAVAEPFKKYGHYNAGFTFAGNPTACAVVIKNTQIMREEKLVENSATMGEFILAECKRMADKHRIIGDVRGKGLMIGLEFVKDKDSKAAFEPKDGCLSAVIKNCYKLGIIPEPVSLLDHGVKGEGIMLTPYFSITKAEATKMLELTDKAISAAEKELLG